MDEYPESEEPKMEGEDDGAITTLIPKSMFGDAKVGDVVRVKIVASLEDELEVEPVSGEEKKEKPERDELEIEMAAIPRM